jgi:hypothetical protein
MIDELIITLRIKKAWSMAHGAWGSHCKGNNNCVKINIVQNSQKAEYPTPALSAPCPMPHAKKQII